MREATARQNGRHKLSGISSGQKFWPSDSEASVKAVNPFSGYVHLQFLKILSSTNYLTVCLLSLGMVRLAGIEPTTLGFGGQYSIH